MVAISTMGIFIFLYTILHVKFWGVSMMYIGIYSANPIERINKKNATNKSTMSKFKKTCSSKMYSATIITERVMIVTPIMRGDHFALNFIGC